MSRRFLLDFALPFLHCLLAVFGGGALAFVPGLGLRTLWGSGPLGPFYPGTALVALLLGFFVSNRLWAGRGAALTWIVGLAWLIYGIYELTSTWSPRWSHDKSAWDYAMKQLFSPSQVCGDTKCLYQFLFTSPFAASVTYSVGSILRKLFARMRHSAADAQI